VKSLFDRLVERWAGIRMLEEQAKAEDVAESLKLGQDLVRAHYRTHLGSNFPEGSSGGSTHIGDVTHNHSETNTNGKGKGWLPKLLLVGGLLASGGVGAAIPELLGLFSEAPSAPVAPAPDSDTQYNLGLGKPDAIPDGKKEDQGR